MNVSSVLERAGAYLNVHLTHSGPAGSPPPAAPFVTLSRETGTHGSAVAAGLAARLAARFPGESWPVYSGNLIEQMLQTNDLPVELKRFLPEDRIRHLEAAIGELVGLHPDLWSLVQKTNDLVRHLARTGHAILLGRGGAFATAGLSHGVHVRLVASPGLRAARTAEALGLGIHEAATHNALRDAARQRYVRAMFDADIADPTAYDLVLNTGRLSIDDMVGQIALCVIARRAGMTAVRSSSSRR